MALHQLKISPLTPVDLMLAKPASTIAEVLKSAAGCSVLLEWKYDGVRAQIHLSGDEGAVLATSFRCYEQVSRCNKVPEAKRVFDVQPQ